MPTAEGSSHHSAVAAGSSAGDVLQIGVFFDGTRYNANNLRRGPAQGAAPSLPLAPTISEALPYPDRVGSSHDNALTNIARLHALYPDRRRDAGAGLSVAIYIEGAGTRDGQPDDLQGLAFGTGISGVQAKVDLLLQQRLPDALAPLARMQVSSISGLQLDLFGFSRGALAARELANRLDGWTTERWQELLQHAGLPLAPTFKLQAATLRFIGLFDTVAAVPGAALGPAPRSFLRAGIARKVLQLAARDEHRTHFALTSVAPEHEQRLLPGAHTDIGGGTDDVIEGPKLLTRPRGERIHAPPVAPMQPPSFGWLRTTQSHRRAEVEARQWQRRLHLGDEAIRVDTWHQWQRQRVAGSDSVLPADVLYVYSAVVLERQVDWRYQLIPLRIMHAAAADAGVRWSHGPDEDAALALPADLNDISTRLLQQQALSATQEALLLQRFVHQSAHWNFDALGDTSLIGAGDATVERLPYRPGPRILYLNRPTADGSRVILANAPPH